MSLSNGGLKTVRKMPVIIRNEGTGPVGKYCDETDPQFRPRDEFQPAGKSDLG